MVFANRLGTYNYFNLFEVDATVTGFIYNIMGIVLIITALTLPIKMYLRWIINLKYIISIPEYFINF